MNDIAQDTHPTVPNRYTSLTALPRIANGSQFGTKACFEILAPALGLPNSQKHFKFYVHEKQGIGLGVLIQMLGDFCIPADEQAELLFE